MKYINYLLLIILLYISLILNTSCGLPMEIDFPVIDVKYTSDEPYIDNASLELNLDFVYDKVELRFSYRLTNSSEEPDLPYGDNKLETLKYDIKNKVTMLYFSANIENDDILLTIEKIGDSVKSEKMIRDEDSKFAHLYVELYIEHAGKKQPGTEYVGYAEFDTDI